MSRRSERGTTLSEVLIALALSALIATPIYIVLQSSFRNETEQGRRLELEAQLESVATRLENDIRDGAPSEKRAGAPATELAIWHTDNDGAALLILWALDGDRLQRQAYDPDSGRTISDVVLLEGLTGSGPLFRYWDSTGGELTPDADRVFRCSVRVTVDLQIRVQGVEAGRTIDIAHREQSEAADAC